MLEGYGQTETSAVATVGHFEDYSLGHVGGPVSCNEMKLVSVPEMSYLATDKVHGADVASGNPGVPCEGRGEICIRGGNVFAGYFKMPEKTQEALDVEGWCHTGDVGMWTPRGQLVIIDRIKNIFKLSQGEYVAAEKIENVLVKSHLVQQVFVYGDSFHHCLVTVVVPEKSALVAAAAPLGVSTTDFDTLCADPRVNKAVLEDLTNQGKAAKLLGFERVVAVHIVPEPFSEAAGLLTPTFKLKRDQLKKVFQPQLDAMYEAQGGVAGKTGLAQGRAH